MQGASSGLRWLQSSRLGWRRSKAWVGWRTGRAWESLGILASWQVKASSCLQRSGCLVRCQLSPGLGKVTTFTIQIVEFALFSGRFIWLLSVLVDEVFYYTSRHEKSCLMEEHTDRQSRHSRPDWGLHQLWQDSSREDWLQWVQEALGGHVVFGIFWSRMEFRALPRWSYELAALSSKIDLRGAIGSFVIWSHLSGERWFCLRLVACWLVRRSTDADARDVQVASLGPFPYIMILFLFYLLSRFSPRFLVFLILFNPHTHAWLRSNFRTSSFPPTEQPQFNTDDGECFLS